MSLDASALKDKSVIVTGGASGIGLATATHFANAGAYVTLADVQDDAGQKAVAELVAKGCHVSFVRCDVTDWVSIVAAFKHAAAFSLSKTIDVAALCAGLVGDKGSLVDQVLAAAPPSLDTDVVPTAPRHLAINVNLVGLYNCAWLALHYMRLPSKVAAEPTFSKSLILVASMAGYGDMPSSSDYNAAKFGVRGLFRGLRHMAPRINVHVNLIAPWWINTPLVQSVLPDIAAAGLAPGKGFTWASMDLVVDAMTRSATDPSMGGKAFAVFPDGYIDFGDDEAGHWAGDRQREQFELLRRRGDFVL